LLQSEVAAFEAECDAFDTTFNLDKLTLEIGKISGNLAVCHASSADSANKIQLHKQRAESLQQRAKQLTKSLEEANEELKGERPPPPLPTLLRRNVTLLGVLESS
jgi:chromosome segregation ATPase